jgi:hypothetical protein
MYLSDRGYLIDGAEKERQCRWNGEGHYFVELFHSPTLKARR